MHSDGNTNGDIFVQNTKTWELCELARCFYLCGPDNRTCIPYIFLVCFCPFLVVITITTNIQNKVVIVVFYCP